MRELCRVGCLVVLACTVVSAQSLPSSKAVAAINTVVSQPCISNSDGTSSCTTNWVDVMGAQIKTSNVADLFVSPSLVTGLLTNTTVKGNNGGSSTATAMGSVEVRVLLDAPFANYNGVVGGTSGVTPAYPDQGGTGVTFNERIQTLTATLSSVISCSSATSCIFSATPEQIQLILKTTSAHTFNFILLNVGTGVHTITIQAKVSSSASGSGGGVAIANALYGLGSVTIDSVRLVNSFSF